MCKFDIDGNCYARACYSNEKCNAIDEFGYPKYMSLDDIPDEVYNKIKKGEKLRYEEFRVKEK